MINHMSYALDKLPNVRGYLQSVDSQIVRGDYASFWKAVEGIDEIIDPRIWETFYESIVERMISDPSYNGGRDWGVHGFAICESEKIHFSIRSTLHASVGRNVVDAPDEKRGAIASTMTSPSVMIVASPEEVTFNVFQLPEGADLDIFDPSKRIRSLGSMQVGPWSRIDVHAPQETLELVASPTAEYCIIELAMRSTISQRWEFDRRTGRPLGAVLLSRDTVVMCSMLGEVGRFRYLPALGQAIDATDHVDFNVRWMAIKCVHAIDPGEGRRALRKACRDAHPYIRAAAMSVLSNLLKENVDAH